MKKVIQIYNPHVRDKDVTREVTDRIFTLTPFHASVSYRFLEFSEFTKYPFHLGMVWKISLLLKFHVRPNEAFSAKRASVEEIMQLRPNCYWVISIRVTNLAGQSRTPQDIVLQIIINIPHNSSCPGYPQTMSIDDSLKYYCSICIP